MDSFVLCTVITPYVDRWQTNTVARLQDVAILRWWTRICIK